MTFEACLAFVFEVEGIVSDDPSDPGGLTKFGISSASYPQVRAVTFSKDDAAKIYHEDFWNRFRCGEMPSGLDLMTFDTGVNQTQQCVRLLQRALKVSADGVLGPMTMAAATGGDVSKLLPEFTAQRAVAYAANPLFVRDGLGWMRRLAACHQLAALSK